MNALPNETITQVISGPGFMQVSIIADGPREAIFLFCGLYGANPNDVNVDPLIRHPSFEYAVTFGVVGPIWCEEAT